MYGRSYEVDIWVLGSSELLGRVVIHSGWECRDRRDRDAREAIGRVRGAIRGSVTSRGLRLGSKDYRTRRMGQWSRRRKGELFEGRPEKASRAPEVIEVVRASSTRSDSGIGTKRGCTTCNNDQSPLTWCRSWLKTNGDVPRS